MQYPKYLGSSVDPEKLSLTVQGLMVGLIPLAVFIAGQFGIDLTNDSLTEVFNLGFAAISAVIVFIGVVRKIVVDTQQKMKN